MKKITFITLLLLSAESFSQQPAQDTILPLPEAADSKVSLDKTLSKLWELDREDQRGTFRFLEYQPMYIMPFRFTDVPTEQPRSLNLNRPIPEHRDYQQVEVKFQVSMKAKILQDAFDKGDVWVAYTQQSHWQMYNGQLSRPFRELNYEPELIFTYPLNFSAGKFKMRMVGLSVNHQSNGKEASHSRSWNRFILIGIFQYKDLLINARFWKRFTEKPIEDNNPQIEDYLGRCEIAAIYPFRKNVFSVRLRNNLRFSPNRSHLELSWLYPISRDLRLFVQATHGYADSLIDYNYKQTTIGVGFTFLNL